GKDVSGLVSPAYAGIDRRPSSPPRRRHGFPRIRGDRPPTAQRSFRPLRFPPHTRGSTLGGGMYAFTPEVSPAYAGIDRIFLVADILRVRFPRIRGDRPSAPTPF